MLLSAWGITSSFSTLVIPRALKYFYKTEVLTRTVFPIHDNYFNVPKIPVSPVLLYRIGTEHATYKTDTLLPLTAFSFFSTPVLRTMLWRSQLGIKGTAAAGSGAQSVLLTRNLPLITAPQHAGSHPREPVWMGAGVTGVPAILWDLHFSVGYLAPTI